KDGGPAHDDAQHIGGPPGPQHRPGGYALGAAGGTVVRTAVLVKRSGLDAEVLSRRLDLRPRLILDGDTVATTLGFEAGLGLARNQDLGRALNERSRLHPLEEGSDLLIEVGGRQESCGIEADHQRPVGEDSLARTGETGAR